MRTVAAAVVAVLAAPFAFAGSIPAPNALPKPGFPAPSGEPSPTRPSLMLFSSRYKDPGTLPPDRPPPPSWAPKTYRGAELETAIRQGSKVFLVYGGRYLIGANTRNQQFRYVYDLATFTRPPNGGWLEPVTWARDVDGVLYVSNAHLTYASATRGRNAYVSAIDLAKKKTIWRSAALVANARTFVVFGDWIVSGYGFTQEDDFLYLLDRRTGKVLDRLEVPSAPEVIKLRGDFLYVRTYDRNVVALVH